MECDNDSDPGAEPGAQRRGRAGKQFINNAQSTNR